MDLSRPRWSELGDGAFPRGTVAASWTDHAAGVEEEIGKIPSFKREMILDEWRILKKLLETREAWKMELLKPYAWLRALVNELGRRLGMGTKIHQLELAEILHSREWPGQQPPAGILALLREREDEEREFRKFSLPDILTLRGLVDILSGDAATRTGHQLEGDPLAPGVAYGEVRVVSDPVSEKPDEWPDNVILAAVCTDPGWTALFARAKAIVVERGGLLSHCAILSREMGIPAVSGIRNIEQTLKNGDRIWVDGNQGRITHVDP